MKLSICYMGHVLLAGTQDILSTLKFNYYFKFNL